MRGWKAHAAALALLGLCFASSLPYVPAGAQESARIASFAGGAGWINSPPLEPEQLRGKVVLVDFWEYTCINCLRTLPYLREWDHRYHDRGFEIVGVHTPEFDFSGERANVAAAAKRLGVTWPIVLDDRFAVWKRYGNTVWPHEYLFDQQGRLLESVAGEGGYQETERRIQEALQSANPHEEFPPVMPLLPEDSYDKPGAVCYPQTPELLVGRRPIADAGASNLPSQDTNYADTAANPKDGAIYLQGYWQLSREAAISGESGGFFALRYHAIQLVAVMRPEGGGAIRVDVMQDDRAVARGDAGKDIEYDGQGHSYVTVNAARAYDLIVNAHFGEHQIELAPKSAGLGIYDVAFESCEIPGTAR